MTDCDRLVHSRTQKHRKVEKFSIPSLLQRDLHPFLLVLLELGISVKQEMLRMKLCLLLEKRKRSAYSSFGFGHYRTMG
jgi:hypothetical protein